MKNKEVLKQSKLRYVLLALTILLTITTVISIYDLLMLTVIESFEKYISFGIGLLVILLLLFIIKTKKRFNKEAKKFIRIKLY